MSIVFVVNEPMRFDQDDEKYAQYGNRVMNLRPAEEFGQLRYLMPAGRVRVTDPVALIDILEKGLAHFDPEKDFLLPVGDMTSCVMASAILAHRCDGFFRVLRWNTTTKRYAMVEVDLAEQN
jgi:hypothetical protein